MQTKRNALYYTAFSVVLLFIEIIIGRYLNHWFIIRAYGGDTLVMPLLYCLIRIVTRKLPRTLPLWVFGIGVLAEITQYFHMSDMLGFERGSLMSILLGTSASWWDIVSYAIGILVIYAGIAIKAAFHKKGDTP